MLQKIKVVVVTVPGSNRVNPLDASLKQSQIFDIEKFDAVMFNRQMDSYKPNYPKQRALYSKELSDGEIGCAISHQEIQSRFKDQGRPIVVLEDDARISNLELFENVTTEFIEKYGDSDAVLSLLPWREMRYLSNEVATNQAILRLFGKAPLTVAYVITPKAMRAMSEANADFAYLPDWPPTKTVYYTTKIGVVRHGDESTTSLIDKTGRRKNGRWLSIMKFTMIPYYLNKSEFFDVKEYFNFAIKPTFTWRLDRIRLR